MRCLLLAEGSHEIGAGHQVRSAILAQALEQYGQQALLCARNLLGSSHIWAWHGFDQYIGDAENLADLIVGARKTWAADYAVIDHYDCNDVVLWDELAHVPCMLRDDIPRSRAIPVSCLVMNSGLQINPSDYPNHASLCGPAWHILPKIFHESSWCAGDYLLLCLGLSDTFSIMERAIEYALQEYGLEIRVICSEEQVIRLQDRYQQIRYFYNEDAAGMAVLFANARCAVLSTSSLALEAMAVGVPFAGIQLVDNQALFAASLAKQDVPVFEAKNIVEAIDSALLLKKAPYEKSLCAGAADEQVVHRLCLHQLCEQRGDLRLVRWSDARDLWEWANDRLTRSLSFSDVAFIPWQGHCSWLEDSLKSPLRQFLLYSDPELGSAAFVRLDVSGDEAHVGIVVAPRARGHGIAVRALSALVEIHRDLAQLRKIVAEIKTENTASLRVFERSGFEFSEYFQEGSNAAQRWVYHFNGKQR